MTRDNKISRRELMALLAKAGVAATGITLLGNCKSPTTPEQPPELPPPVAVSVLVRFYNHTQGYLGEKVFEGMSDSPLEVKISDCPYIGTVEPNRIAVREAAHGSWLGKLIEFSLGERLETAKFPKQNMEYDAFLMNKGNGTNYEILHSGRYYLGLQHSPNATWDREDHDATGPDEVPHEAMRQVRETLQYPWAKYMEFTELPPNVRGDFWVGYASGPGPSDLDEGGFSELCAWINPAAPIFRGDVNNVMKLRLFIEKICGHITLSYDNQGAMATYGYITDNNGINQIGKDLLAYSVVRDPVIVR